MTSPLLLRYVARAYAQFFATVMLVVLAVYTVADFGDRLKLYASADWADVAALYGNKMLVMVVQLAPAAMLLAAGAAISSLRQRGELTAMRALGVSPTLVLAPVAAVALALAAGLVAFDELVASPAGDRVDRLQVERFNLWGDYRQFHIPVQWLRVGDHIFQVRGDSGSSAPGPVTIFTVRDDFTLASRLDADRLEHLGDDRWRLVGVRERHFGETSGFSTQLEAERRFAGTTAETFLIRPGRPEQMGLGRLREQLRVRAQAGLPTRRYQLAAHLRFAGPLMGVVAAVLAALLALRPNRKGHLTVALLEGLVVAAGLWGLLVVGKALALAEHVSAAVAAWGPCVLLLLLAGALLFRLERRPA